METLLVPPKHTVGLVLLGVNWVGPRADEFMPYTPVANITGQPAMSVPLCWNDEGLPIGMYFAGRYGDEATLFRLARPPYLPESPLGNDL
jgi:hypothetical protein